MLLRSVAKEMINAKSLLFLTGAGMSIDSGIIGYKDKKLFWQKYPFFKDLGVSPEYLASAYAYKINPKITWTFLEKRRRDLIELEPHAGYQVMNKWCEQWSSYIYTMNTDGYHLRSGAKNVREAHGCLWKFQCANHLCPAPIIEAPQSPFCQINPITNFVENPPQCSTCGEYLRPNTLMFGDRDFKDDEAEQQRFVNFLSENSNTVVFIIGCSGRVPSNHYVANYMKKDGNTIVMIDPADPKYNFRDLADYHIPLGAKEALLKIDEELRLK